MTGIGLIVSWLSGAAFAGDTVVCGLEGAAKIDLSGITAMAIRGVEGNVEVVPGDALEVRQGANVCAATAGKTPVTVQLVRKGTVLVATVKAPDTNDLKLTFSVPRGLEALTIDHQIGALTVRDLAARVAVVSNTGSVDVAGAKSLRVAYGTGDVFANDVGSDVTVDHVVGNLKVDNVAGSLATSAVTGTVVHNNVKGTVQAL